MKPDHIVYFRNHPVYQQIKELREDDEYDPKMETGEIYSVFFPPTVKDLVLDLSNITSIFYGLMLKEGGKMLGDEKIDALSKSTFYELGRVKAVQAITKKPDIDRDARGICLTFLSAILTSSPEYKIQIVAYEPEKVRIIVKGVDRYHRIAKEIDIQEKISWPTLDFFFKGINDALQLQYVTYFDIKSLDDNSKCWYDIRIVKTSDTDDT